MLSVHCNTVQRKGKGKWRVTRPLACQHSGRWHLLEALYSLIDKLGTHLRHETNIPFWAQSSGWICKRAWLVGGAFCEHPKGHRGTPELRASSSQRHSGDHLEVTDGCHPGTLCVMATVLSVHRALRLFTLRRWGHPLGDGQDSPKLMQLLQLKPTPKPPKPLSQAAHWDSDH